jgi:valyl-tRNA synthetase
MSKDNQSLWKRLHSAEVLEEFCELMFAQEERYEDLLEQLEKWGISSSMGALSRFSDSQRSGWTLERAKRQYEAMLEDNGTNLDEAQRKVVAERLYNLAASPHISEKALLKMKDQEIALATVRQNDERLKQNERKLEQAQETIDLQKRKIEALEAQAEAAAKAVERAKEAVKGGTMDDGTREALLAEVDAIMLGKPKPQREAA